MFPIGNKYMHIVTFMKHYFINTKTGEILTGGNNIHFPGTGYFPGFSITALPVAFSL
jgi:hypothetical protein